MTETKNNIRQLLECIFIMYWPCFFYFPIRLRNAPETNRAKISFWALYKTSLISLRLYKPVSNWCQPRKTHQSERQCGFVSESRISKFLPNHHLYLEYSRSKWLHCRNEYQGFWNELCWRQWTTSGQGSLLRFKETFRPFDIWVRLGNKDDL